MTPHRSGRPHHHTTRITASCQTSGARSAWPLRQGSQRRRPQPLPQRHESRLTPSGRSTGAIVHALAPCRPPAPPPRTPRPAGIHTLCCHCISASVAQQRPPASRPRRPWCRDHEDQAGGPLRCGDDSGSAAGSTLVALPAGGGVLTTAPNSAAEYFLQKRTFTGVETPATGAPVKSPEVAAKGRSGRAAVYDSEARQ